MTAPLRVVFIGGYTRSGSTLLDRLLGTSPGVRSVGEIRHAWGMGLLEDRLCGCGEPFRSCPFWRAVIEEAFGGPGNVDAARLWRHEQQLFRARHAPFLRHPRFLPAALPRWRADFIESRGRLLKAVANVAGVSTIVDSSKNPSYGLLLSAIPGVEVYTVHLVRDARATSFSWTRRKADQRHRGEAAFFPQRRPVISATWWTVNSVLMEMTSRQAPRPHLRVRYEDLVARPGRELARIRRFAGLAAPPPSSGEDAFDLDVHHSIGGNPMRFEQGRVAVREDAEWRKAMPLGARTTVTAIALPLLLKYRYIP